MSPIASFQHSLNLLGNYPFVIAIICYIPNVMIYSSQPWIYDDFVAITENPCVVGMKRNGENVSWSCLLTDDFWGTPMERNESHKSYRPVTSFLFRIEHNLWGTNDSRPWHAVSVISHGICTQLVFLVARALFPDESSIAPQIAAVFFAVHPVHTDCVSNVTGRCEVLAAIFMLSAFLLSLKLKSTALSLPMCLLLTVAATLSKEQGFTVLGIIVIHICCQELHHLKTLDVTKSPHKRLQLVALKNVRISTLIRLTLWIISGTFLFWCRLLIQHRKPVFHAWQNPSAFHPVFQARFLSRIYLIFYHAYLLIWPTILCPDYSNSSVPVVESILDQRLFIPFVWLIVCFIGIIATARHCLQTETNATPVVMSLAWLLIPFVPAASVLFPVGFTVAERVLFSPSVGFCLLLGLFCGKIWSWTKESPQFQRWCRSGLFLVIGLLAIRTMLRDYDWNNSMTLWETSIKACPVNAVSLGNRALDIEKMGQHREAEDLFKKAAVVTLPIPNVGGAMKLAGFYRKRGQLQKARQICEEYRMPEATFCLAQIAEKERMWLDALVGYSSLMKSLKTTEEYHANHLDFVTIRLSHLYCTLEQDRMTNNFNITMKLAQSILNDTKWPIEGKNRAFVFEKRAAAYGYLRQWDLMERETSSAAELTPSDSQILETAIKFCYENDGYDLGLRFAQQLRDKLKGEKNAHLEVFDKWTYLRQETTQAFMRNDHFLRNELQIRADDPMHQIHFLLQVILENTNKNDTVHAILLLRNILGDIGDRIEANDEIKVLPDIYYDLKDNGTYPVLNVYKKMTEKGETVLKQIVADIKRDIDVMARSYHLHWSEKDERKFVDTDATFSKSQEDEIGELNEKISQIQTMLSSKRSRSKGDGEL